jgi:hypothetical protein
MMPFFSAKEPFLKRLSRRLSARLSSTKQKLENAKKQQIEQLPSPVSVTCFDNNAFATEGFADELEIEDFYHCSENIDEVFSPSSLYHSQTNYMTILPSLDLDPKEIKALDASNTDMPQHNFELQHEFDVYDNNFDLISEFSFRDANYKNDVVSTVDIPQNIMKRNVFDEDSTDLFHDTNTGSIVHATEKTDLKPDFQPTYHIC